MEEEIKQPMYYEQINKLMNLMSKFSIGGSNYRYFQTFKQLYSRIRPDLSPKRKKFFDDKIEEIEIRNKDTDIYCFKTAGLYKMEIELFKDLDKLEIFKVLKQQIIER